jgi:hypothetical protein
MIFCISFQFFRKRLGAKTIETSKTFKQTLKKKIIRTFITIWIEKKILVYVKDIEGSNLNIMIIIINSMVNYKTLGVMEKI